MIKVVNRRSVNRVQPGVLRVYVGRPSPLGNPFVIGHRDGSREDVIRKYRAHLLSAIERKDERIVAALNCVALATQRGEVELECWCSPAPCHADVIKSVVEQRLQERSKR